MLRHKLWFYEQDPYKFLKETKDDSVTQYTSLFQLAISVVYHCIEFYINVLFTNSTDPNLKIDMIHQGITPKSSCG